MMTQDQLIRQPLTELALTESFCLRSKLMGFGTIRDIIDTPVETILEKEDFSYSWLNELVRLMRANNMLYKLQPMPGSTVC